MLSFFLRLVFTVFWGIQLLITTIAMHWSIHGIVTFNCSSPHATSSPSHRQLPQLNDDRIANSIRQVAWLESTDYLFLRNNIPDFSRLKGWTQYFLQIVLTATQTMSLQWFQFDVISSLSCKQGDSAVMLVVERMPVSAR